LEIKQIADDDLRTHVAQRLGAFVFMTHHRTHRFVLLQQDFGNPATYCTDSTCRAGDQDWSAHARSPM
jgi:hypothetical protein